MSTREHQRSERRAKAHSTTRVSILAAARRVALRDGARNLSLRGVAAEAGFAPAALYGYFAGKNELLLALAADDLASLARTMRNSSARNGCTRNLAAAAGAALSQLTGMETMAAAASALSAVPGSGESERQFNGRLIATLNALSDAGGMNAKDREAQCDVVLLAATLTGLAVLSRSGRLAALGFTQEELLQRLERRFAP
ncbi:MAG: TetR family transcriptional regulator [Rhizomicrobium sp.]|jgi:AcrR family transcriptional regulator